MNGYPTDISVWGWIDGKRVDNSTFIEYGMDEGPNEHGMNIIQTIGDADAAQKDKPKRDERYSNKYECKYDASDRLIEKLTYQNNGKLWTRETFVYKTGKIERTKKPMSLKPIA